MQTLQRCWKNLLKIENKKIATSRRRRHILHDLWLINFFLSWAFSVAHRDALIVYNTIYYTALESQIWNFLVIFTIIMGSGGYVSHSVLPVGSFHHFITLSIVLQTDRQTFLQNHSELALLKSKGSMLQRVLMWPRSSLSTCGVEYSHYEYSSTSWEKCVTAIYRYCCISCKLRSLGQMLWPG